MNSKIINLAFAIGLSTILIGSMAVMPTMAQESGNTTNTDNERKIEVEISDNVYIEDYEFHGNNQSITITLNQYDSGLPNRVQISNFLYDINGGIKNYDTTTVLVQNRTTVNFDLRKINGQMAVLIQHKFNGEILTYDESLFNFTNEYNSAQTGIMFLAGGMLGVTGVTIIAIKRKWEMQTEIRRRL
jgi:hypothetical protein